MFYSVMKILLILLSISCVIVGVIIFKKNKSKIPEIVFSILLSAVFFVLEYPINQNIDSTQNSSEIIIDTKDTQVTDISTSDITQNTETDTYEEADSNVQLLGNKIKKNLSYDDSSCEVKFVAPVSGKYRFDFFTSDVQTDYSVILTDSKNETIFESEYSTYEHGITEQLIKGEYYTLTISQKEGYPKSTVEIHVPSKNAILEFND